MKLTEFPVDNDLEGIFLNTFDQFNVSALKTTLKHTVCKATQKNIIIFVERRMQ